MNIAMGQTTGAIPFLLIICIALYNIENANCVTTVTIGNSRIVGQLVYSTGDAVTQFLGIPYAEPPVGRYRFQKPIPQRSLPVFNLALNNPPVCWQSTPYPFPWYDASPNKNEDCLYLNIWAPEAASADNKKAVLYFIHGGGLRYGSIGQHTYNGAVMAARGDVIVVTVNYRLGPFGFLSSGTEDAPGNVGLYDILEGLKWVNKHIGAFGGDESRITIAGQGSGSTAVGLLSISPLAKGLFQRQIMESGSPAYPDKESIQLNMDLSQTLAEKLSCANETFTIQDNPSQVVKCLKRISAPKLDSVVGTINPLSTMLFVPQFGDELLPTDPHESIQKNDLTCNELLIGNTNDEGSYQLTTHNPRIYGFFGVLDPEINKTFGANQIKETFSDFTDPDSIADHYLPSSLADDAYDRIREQVYTSFGDATINCPAKYYAGKCASNGGNVYYYVWNHRPSKSVWFPWMGAAHFTEVEFVFGKPLLQSFNFKPDELDLSKNMIEAWSSFVKNGKPSVPWPEYTKEDPQFKYLEPRSNMTKNDRGFHEDNCNFFRSFYGF